MTDWLEMTEAQREEVNDEAHNAACDRLRSVQHRTGHADMAEIRRLAFAELLSDMDAARRDIKHGERARATKRDQRDADYGRRTLAKLGLVEGFIWDAEI